MTSEEIMRGIELGKMALATVPEPARELLLLGARIAENVVATAASGNEIQTMRLLAERVTRSWQEDLDSSEKAP